MKSESLVLALMPLAARHPDVGILQVFNDDGWSAMFLPTVALAVVDDHHYDRDVDGYLVAERTDYAVERFRSIESVVYDDELGYCTQSELEEMSGGNEFFTRIAAAPTWEDLLAAIIPHITIIERRRVTP